MMNFQDYIVAGVVLISNAFCTGIGVTLGVYFTNKAVLKRREQEIDIIVKKVIEEIDKRQEALENAPKFLQGKS